MCSSDLWIVDVDSPARAYQIAAEASTAPGPGGAPMNLFRLFAGG